VAGQAMRQDTRHVAGVIRGTTSSPRHFSATNWPPSHTARQCDVHGLRRFSLAI
jgi:hypothetical protein